MSERDAADNKSMHSSDYDSEGEPLVYQKREPTPGISVDDMKTYASGVNVTPFEWNFMGKTHNMKLISGFAGATMTDDGYIMPLLAWGVANDG